MNNDPNCETKTNPTPFSLLLDMTRDERMLAAVTRVLRTLAELESRRHTGPVTLDMADGFVRSIRVEVVQRW